MDKKPRLLVLSAVYPFPGKAGQQQRVYYKLRALREKYHLTFLTHAAKVDVESVHRKLLDYCDDAVVIPSLYTSTRVQHLVYRILGSFYMIWTGLKMSNYLNGEMEFSAGRVKNALQNMQFDGVIFEYWHAHKLTKWFKSLGAKTILDMHDILWRSYSRQLALKKYIPSRLKRWMVRRYQVREEAAWNEFDVLIAINQDELNYARQNTHPALTFLYAPMGTDLSRWPYSWQPAANPKRIAYYGSLGSVHNQLDALLCYREIMPVIWQKFPGVEFWIVGSDPPSAIKNLESDPRVHVTGFVEHPQEVLKTMSLVLCPWSGTYGFRSRVVEVMALGVPIVASEDAVFGMDFKEGQGIVLANTPARLTSLSVDLISDDTKLEGMSKLARRQVEESFSFETTYGTLVKNLFRLCPGN